MTERNFEITYENGAKVHVKCVPRAKYGDLIILQRELLVQFLYNDGMLGDLLSPLNEATWTTLNGLLAILPTVEVDPINPEQMSFDELLRVFFTTSSKRDEQTGAIIPDQPGTPYLPSEIAKLHGLSFFHMDGVSGLWQKAREQVIQMLRKKEQERVKPNETTQETTVEATGQETPTLTPSVS